MALVTSVTTPIFDIHKDITATTISYSTPSRVKTVRVKGGMSLWNGMWHGLRNDIIMQNVKYENWRKEKN